MSELDSILINSKDDPVAARIYQMVVARRIKDKLRRKLWSNVEQGGYFQWVKDNWTSRGEPLDFVQHKYLEGLYQDQAPFIAMMKSAQTGGTERMVTEALWLPDMFRENSIYVFPTAGSVGDLVQERVDDPLNERAYLRRVSGRETGMSGGKHADKVGLKRMSKGFVYFRGSGSPRQITSVPGDLIIADEVDRMPPQNIPYIPKRLEHSKRRWQRWLSTPTIPNFGIHKIFLTTDQRYYNIKCTHCGEVQVLDFWKNVEYTLRNDTIVENEKLVCVKCREIIIPWECEGEWIATAESDRHGYHISKLYSPRMDLKDLIESSLKTSEWELQQFYNQDLGVPYEPKGGKLSDDELHACVRNYTLPLKEGDNFMGIDVGLKLHVIIQNSFGKIVFIGSRTNFEELDTLMDEYNVKKAVIDAMPETRKSQEFVSRYRGRAVMCYYSMKTVDDKKWWKKDKDKEVVHTNRTISLDMLTGRFRAQTLLLPKTLDDYNEFKDHMKALTRVVLDNVTKVKDGQLGKDSNPTAEYLQTGPDHFYHAANYSNLACELFAVRDEPEIFTL